MLIVSLRSENTRLFGWEKGNILQRHTLVSILGFIHRTRERPVPVSEVCVKTFQCRRNFVHPKCSPTISERKVNDEKFKFSVEN